MIITKIVQFHAAHKLSGTGGACDNLHGHTYKMHISIEGDVDPKTGMVIDFHALKKIINEEALSQLDHHYLNDFIEQPTVENIAEWVWKRLKPKMAGLHEIKIFETDNSYVTYIGI